MNPPLHIRQVRIHRLAIPMRIRFEHALAAREVADPLIVELNAAAPFAHLVGYGETLARPYVTGETPASVIDDILNHFFPLLAKFQPTSFVEALEAIETLPTQLEGRIVTAARATVELALLDLACQAFRRRPADVAGWLGLPGFGPPGCLATARYSGIAVGSQPSKLKTTLRLQRLFGLRDFKLKVAVDGWQDKLAVTHSILAKPLATGTATLRVDVNGGWSLAEITEALPILEEHSVSAIEQPLPESEDPDLAYLAERTRCDIAVDESLITTDDAQRLIDGRGVRIFNIRIAKNGGLLPSLQIARLALAAGLDVQLGCMVGETSILTAAGLAFLEACPRARFVEGGYTRFLLRRDVSRRTIGFGFRGRARARSGFGLGVTIDTTRLLDLASESPRVRHL